MEYQGLTLDPFQEEAVEYIEDGRSVLVAAPTGTGKTLIADYLIEEILEDGGEVVYTAPVKALSNQKYREYCRTHGAENVGLITGDLVINRDAPLRIMTTEILRNVLLEGGATAIPQDDTDSVVERPGSRTDDHDDAARNEPDDEQLDVPVRFDIPDLEDLEAVIVDEIHFMDDPHRGTVWEELMIYLPPRIRILGLSATLSNLNEFADWLTEIRGTDVKVVREEERAVPLHIRLANNQIGMVSIEEFDEAYDEWKHNTSKAEKEQGGMTKHTDLLEMLPPDNFPALYFVFSRKMVEKLSDMLAKSSVSGKLQSLSDRKAIEEKLDEFAREYPDVLTPRLRAMYTKGIAAHHAGLHVALKALVEELYEEKLLQIVYCTSTFALGINMPARTVMFDGLSKFNGTEFAPLTVREFMQMGGRAGRRGIDPVGEVVVRQDFRDYDEVQGLIKKLVSNESEPVTSSFNLSFHSVVNLLDNHTEERIRHILQRSFKAYQAEADVEPLEEELAEKRQTLDAKQEQTDTPTPEQLVKLRRLRREVARLEREVTEHARPRLWEEFQRKVEFLRTYGYIGPNGELLDPAHILKHIKFEEIFLTELILEGVLEDLTPEELFGVMCGLVHQLPRRATVDKPNGDKWWDIFSQVNAVYQSDIIEGAEELSGHEAVLTPEMMPLGERWAHGETLQQILQSVHNQTDLSGGLVGAFRRAKDLVGQLREVHWEDEHRRKQLGRLIRQVSRDEVQVLD